MGTLPDRVGAVRRFSRFYTKQIGLLDEGILQSPYSLTEARVFYELAHGDGKTATDVAAELAIDPGYLSRILRSLGRRGLIEKTRSPDDRRRVFVTLTAKGREAFAQLNAGSEAQIRALLERLAEPVQRRLVEAMGAVEEILGDGPGDEPRPAFTLRPHRPGDLGWVVQRHGEIYHASHGWDERFEATCAAIAARFLERFDPRWERSWIAERGGARVGAVFLVRRSRTVGQLRMLFVEPSARGLGIGARLVSECVGHARHVGYGKMTLFTVRGLDSARRLYEAEGFRLVDEVPSEAWGKKHVEQTWELAL